MSYRNERFNRSMRSLEVIVTGITDVSKAKVFSDCGTGVRRMLAALDCEKRSLTEQRDVFIPACFDICDHQYSSSFRNCKF